MQATTVLRLHITQPVFAGVGHKKIGKDIQMMKRKQEKLKNLKEKRDEQQQYKGKLMIAPND